MKTWFFLYSILKAMLWRITGSYDSHIKEENPKKRAKKGVLQNVIKNKSVSSEKSWPVCLFAVELSCS